MSVYYPFEIRTTFLPNAEPEATNSRGAAPGAGAVCPNVRAHCNSICTGVKSPQRPAGWYGQMCCVSAGEHTSPCCLQNLRPEHA